MEQEKKSYKEIHGKTRVGAFLQKAAPALLDVAGDITGVGALNKLGDAISGSKELSENDKAIALQLIELDKVDAQEVTKRWESDNQQEDWLPRNIRPITLVVIVVFSLAMIALESAGVIEVKDAYVSMLELLCLTTIGAYFGVREIGKFTKRKFK